MDWRAVRPPSLLTVRWSGEARRHVGSSGRTRRPDCAVDGHGLPLSGADENDVPVRRHRLFACSSSARLLLHAYHTIPTSSPPGQNTGCMLLDRSPGQPDRVSGRVLLAYG